MSNTNLVSGASDAMDKAVSAINSACIELNAIQNQVVEQFKVADQGILKQRDTLEGARKTAHSEIDDKYNNLQEGLKAQRKELKKSYSEKLIEVGIKEPDMVLADTAVVKVIDTTAKKALGFLGRGFGYVKNAVQQGMKQ